VGSCNNHKTGLFWFPLLLVAFLSDPWGVATGKLALSTLTLFMLHFYLTRGELQLERYELIAQIYNVAFLSDPWGVATRKLALSTLTLFMLHFYLTRGELQL